MSASLTYYSEEKVSASVQEAIEADARAIDHDWWCESFVFFKHPKAKGRLWGDTKYSVLGYSTARGRYVEVDPEDDMFMSAREVAFLVKHLSRWSEQHGITWLLHDEYQGDVGKIIGGKADAGVQKYLRQLADMYDRRKHETGPEAEKRAAAILKKHAARNGADDEQPPRRH
jgi:hypothetical protein